MLDAGDTVVNETDTASSKILTKERVAELEVGMDNEQALLPSLEDLIREKSGDIPERWVGVRWLKMSNVKLNGFGALDAIPSSAGLRHVQSSN